MKKSQAAKQAKKARYYVGLANSAHDPAIAIVNPEGQMVFAESTERYLQNKRAWLSAPDHLNRMNKLIKRYCDPEADIICGRTWTKWSYVYGLGMVAGTSTIKHMRRLASTFLDRPTDPDKQASPIILDMLFAMPKFFWKAQYLSNSVAGVSLSIQQHLMNRQVQFDVTLKNVDHHTTHAMAACYTSPYEEAVCAIVDGMGEGTSTSFYHYVNGNVTPLRGKNYKTTASLGTFYMILCELCGFDFLKGEEWKVMGLAPYGRYDERIANILRPLISTDGLKLKSKLTTRGLDSIRRTPDQPAESAANLAYTGQKLFEECMFELLSNLHKLGISDNLIMGGGCCLNSSCNGKILDNTGFNSLHVDSCPGDDGNAMGAAWHLFKKDNPDFQPVPGKTHSPYLGSDLHTESLTNLKRFGGLEKATIDKASIIKQTAHLIADGKVVGWARGRAEFGPRALGNRSIIADARDPNIKDKINGRVKFREEFRPFAPSILDEYGEEYFEHYQFTPYMERTLKFKQSVMNRVPGVVHGDGTGRLQSVTRELNPDYYQLIDEFRKLTGVPLILNTSFNIMGKPIIHSVEDAIAVFYTTGLDVLVLEDVLIMKPGVEISQNTEVISLRS